jgi:hypothetical protein
MTRALTLSGEVNDLSRSSPKSILSSPRSIKVTDKIERTADDCKRAFVFYIRIRIWLSAARSHRADANSGSFEAEMNRAGTLGAG